MIKRVFLLVERIKNKFLKTYREYIFFCLTGQKVKLVKNVTLINRNLKIGKNVTLYPDVMFYGDGLIEIGDNVEIGNGTIIYASKEGGVSIGENTLIAAQCYLIDMDHGVNRDELIRNQSNTVSPIKIGKDVWIAANVTILKGSNVGDGAIVGAKGLVKGSVPSGAIVVGNPAKILKYRE